MLANVYVGPSTPQATCDDGEMRLIGGNTSLEGRVEICYNRAWGTICSDGFGAEDADVVCRQNTLPYNGDVKLYYNSKHQCTIYIQFFVFTFTWCIYIVLDAA